MVAGAVDGGGWHRRRRFEIRQRRIVGETVLHAVGAAVDDDGVGAVQEAVEDGGGDAGVVVEDGRPLFVGLVGGEDNRAALVALADDLEEQIGAGFVEGRFTSPGGGDEAGWTETVRRFNGHRAVVAELIYNGPQFLGMDPWTTFDSGEPTFGCWMLIFRCHSSNLEFVISDGVFTVSFPVETGAKTEVVGLPAQIFDRIRAKAAQLKIDPRMILADLMPVGLTPQRFIVFWPSGKAQLKNYDQALSASKTTKSPADV